MASNESDSPITVEEYTDVKRALTESQARVQDLVQTNKGLKQEISLLHNMVSKTQKHQVPFGLIVSQMHQVPFGLLIVSKNH